MQTAFSLRLTDRCSCIRRTLARPRGATCEPCLSARSPGRGRGSGGSAGSARVGSCSPPPPGPAPSCSSTPSQTPSQRPAAPRTRGSAGWCGGGGSSTRCRAPCRSPRPPCRRRSCSAAGTCSCCGTWAGLSRGAVQVTDVIMRTK